jgi:type I restriction enzyme S subunit
MHHANLDKAILNNCEIIESELNNAFLRGAELKEAILTNTLLNNINAYKINLSKTKVYISEKEAFGKYKHFLIDEGDLVIASSGIIVDNFYNKIAFIKKEHLPLCMNTSTIRFKSLDSNIIDLNYFKFFLKTKFFSNQLQKLITGSAQLNFGPSHLKKIDLRFLLLKSG